MSPLYETPRTAPAPDDYRRPMAEALSFGSLLLAFMLSVDLVAEVRVAPNEVPPPAPVAVDLAAREAIALVRQWRPAGDDLAVHQRLHGDARRPGDFRAWSAEKSDAGSYLVTYREPAGSPVYAFEADLESGAVLGSPETMDLLTAMRLRDQVEAQGLLVAGMR